jgi:hypothetical protein
MGDCDLRIWPIHDMADVRQESRAEATSLRRMIGSPRINLITQEKNAALGVAEAKATSDARGSEEPSPRGGGHILLIT